MVRDRGLEVPFIFVSGTIGEEIAVEAMKNGADDYIIKNNLNRLIPAINRELRDAEVRRERSKAEERIRHLAYYDSLTDLPNRTLFQNRLEMAVANALRTRNPLSVLIMDLDGFKEINDTMGHLMGDAVLREIGHRLQSELRESDTVARLGGDEFAVMLPGVGQTGAELAARKLIAAVQEPLTIEGSEPRRARQRGHRDRARARHRGRSARAARRCRDVCGQGRSLGLRRLCARARPPQSRTAGADGRLPARDLARRAARRLSAEDQPEDARRSSASKRSSDGSIRSSGSSCPIGSFRWPSRPAPCGRSRCGCSNARCSSASSGGGSATT